ncbi:MAG: hypothetical protein ACE5GE_05385 [Phycisphaerae bacterium]
MAVRFLCPGCDQPLEVDDEWASKPVACPYCRKTVMVPAESTFRPETVGPQASPLAGPLSSPADEIAAHARVSRPSSLAQWALGLSVAGLALWLAFSFTAAPKIRELAGPQATPEELQQALLEQIRSGTPDWMVMASLTVLASLAAWVAGLVCGIIAMAQPNRSRLAVGSLVVSALTILSCCVGPM